MIGAIPLLLLYAFMTLVANVAVSFILERIFLLFFGRWHCITHAQCATGSNVSRQGFCRHATGFLKVYCKLREKCLSVFVIVVGFNTHTHTHTHTYIYIYTLYIHRLMQSELDWACSARGREENCMQNFGRES
jgi:hypothetical protein